MYTVTHSVATTHKQGTSFINYEYRYRTVVPALVQYYSEVPGD